MIAWVLALALPLPIKAATNTFLLNYANRAALVADGWSFNAITNAVTQSVGNAVFSPVPQNTEITDTNVGAVALYAQTNTALGTVLRIPCDVGHIWGSTTVWTNGTWPSLATDPSANQTRNGLFRSLPTNWVSLRLKCAFDPAANYEGVNLLLYRDDDNYVSLAFRHNSDTAQLYGLPDPSIAEFAQEFFGFPNTAAAAAIPGTNVTLRLDRDVATADVSAYFSTNGTSWVLVGRVAQELTNTQIGIVIEGAPSTFPLSKLVPCDLSRLDIITTNSYTPVSNLAFEPQHLVFNAVQNQPCTVTQRVITVVRPLESPFSWNVTSSAPWLLTRTASGQTPGFAEASVNTTGLAPGIYQASLSFSAVGIANSPAGVAVTLIVNPAGPVGVSPWKDARSGAMSVWVDDSDPTAFDDLSTNGFVGTYVMWHTAAPAFYTTYAQSGMELGSHTIDHAGFPIHQAAARFQMETNIQDLVTTAPVAQKDVISFAWPAGVTSPDEESVGADYFLVCRGYNVNQLEDPSPADFMNLKSYNSHEHAPFPPADLKTVVDAAIAQGKWFNLVLHATNNDNGAILYAKGKNIWFATAGAVTKYIYQRDRVVITNYQQTSDFIQFNCYRLPLDPSSRRSFETAIRTNDTLTLLANISGSQVYNLTVNGVHKDFTNNGSQIYFDTLVTTNPQTVVIDLRPNSAPSLSPQPDFLVDELATLTVTNAGSDPDVPAQTLSYTLQVTNLANGQPQGNATVGTNGVITWTPTQLQSHSTNRVTTIVTDNGYPPLTATNSFLVTVREVNQPPQLPAQSNRFLITQQALVVSNAAVEPNIHSLTLGYALTAAPAGASIDSLGTIHWTPSPAQAPSTNTFTTVVTNSNPFDSLNPQLAATNSFLVFVQTNLLVLPSQSPRSLNELDALAVTNSALLLTNLPNGLLTNSLPFTYPNRAALLADGWSFLARNENGSTRDTEVTNPAVGTLAYGQTNGVLGTVLRMPCDLGNLWGVPNTTRNALFHSLPTNWVSLRLSLSFDPTTNYQQAQLLLYQDDDNYVEVDRAYNSFDGVQCVEFSRETSQVPATLNFASQAATNVVLRLDRAPGSSLVQGLYSTDGIAWISLGQTSQSLTNTELGVWVGGALGSYSNTLVTCDVSRLDIVTTNTAPPIVYTLTVTNTLDGSLVTNATIDGNGIIHWTPTEAQGPGVYAFTTSASYGGLQAANTFLVTVNELNLAPVLPAQTNRTLAALQSLVVTNTATDSDIPANSLGYQLAGAPFGASIDSVGIVTWTPSPAQVPGVYLFTTVVTDTNIYAINTQNLSATNQFLVTALALSDEFHAVSTTFSGGIGTISWTSVPGQSYRLQYKNDLRDANWIDLAPDVTAVGPLSIATNLDGSVAQRFYRIELLSPPNGP